MKKLILCIAIATSGGLSLAAQDGQRIFKRFKGDVSLGYAKPIGSGSSGGVLFALEPKFALIDKLSVGLRIEGAVMARFSGYDLNGNAQVKDGQAALSFHATTDYYFTNNYSFRPYMGAGGGLFALANIDDEYTDPFKFGGMIRVGAEVRHFRFGVEYNIIPDTEINSYIYDNMGNLILRKVKSKNGYFGIKAGFCFGGAPH